MSTSLSQAEKDQLHAALRAVIAERNRVHVIPSIRGNWVVRSEDRWNVRKVFRSREDAVERGRVLAASIRGELVIHGRDGGVLERESFREPLHRVGGSKSS